jgi:hypothetical protein
MGDIDGNDMDDMSGYERSGVRLALLGLGPHVSVFLPARSGVVRSVSGMVN